MTTAKTKGSGFLKVTGILMIIGGGISIILGIIAALGVAALAYISDGEISSAMLYASVAAGTCMVWGIIVAVLCVVGTILNSVGGGSFSVFSLLLGLVLPVLYIIGAGFNKKEYIA